jgi:hypothetical protein
MGKLIKHQWARLIVLTAGTYLIWAAFWGFFYPKSFFDMFTPIFNSLVAPIPILQILNLLSGISILLLEWPLPFIKGHTLQRAYSLRFAVYPIVAVLALIQYQCTNASFYLLIGAAYDTLYRGD